MIAPQARDVLLQRIDPIPYVCFDNAREKNVYLNCELSPLFVFCEFCELESQKSLEWWSSRYSPQHWDRALIYLLFPLPLQFFPSSRSCSCLAQTCKFYDLWYNGLTSSQMWGLGSLIQRWIVGSWALIFKRNGERLNHMKPKCSCALVTTHSNAIAVWIKHGGSQLSLFNIILGIYKALVLLKAFYKHNLTDICSHLLLKRISFHF